MAARRRAAKKTLPRKAGAANPKKAAVDDGAAKPGLPIEVVLSVCTGVLLFGAWLMLDYEKGSTYGVGTFFKNEYGATE